VDFKRSWTAFVFLAVMSLMKLRTGVDDMGLNKCLTSCACVLKQSQIKEHCKFWSPQLQLAVKVFDRWSQSAGVQHHN
jgi:uncharacterized protein (DUF1499 family)